MFPWIEYDATKTGNARWSGYLVDVLNGLSTFTGTTMEMVVVPHLDLNREDVGEILSNGTIDVHPWLLSEASYARNVTKRLDYTTPFLTFHHDIITHITVKTSRGWGLFEPFDNSLWCIIFGTLIILAIVTWAAEAFPVDTTVESDFPMSVSGFFGSFYYLFSVALVGGTDWGAVKTGPGRMVQIATMFFFLIFTATYTANLASIFTAVNVNYAISNINDLRSAMVCDPALDVHPVTDSFSASKVIPPSELDWEHMRERMDHCAALVRSQEVKALVAYGPTITKYLNDGGSTGSTVSQIPAVDIDDLCENTGAPMGLEFAETYFSFAVTRRPIPGLRTSLHHTLSGAIIGLQMSDQLATIYKRHFESTRTCGQVDTDRIASVTFVEMRGLFIMVGIATGCAVLARLGLLARAYRAGEFP